MATRAEFGAVYGAGLAQGVALAAFGIGPLEETIGLSLSTIYVAAALIAVALGGLSFVVARASHRATA